MRRGFIVNLTMPPCITIEEMKSYIKSAVSAWKGQLHPEDPLFDLNEDTIIVSHIPHKQRRREVQLDEESEHEHEVEIKSLNESIKRIQEIGK